MEEWDKDVFVLCVVEYFLIAGIIYLVFALM